MKFESLRVGQERRSDPLWGIVNRRVRACVVVLGFVALAACAGHQAPLAGVDPVEPVRLLVSDVAEGETIAELEGRTLAGIVSVVVEGPATLSAVGFYLNAEPEPVAVTRSRPFLFTLDTTTLADGEHRIAAARPGESGAALEMLAEASFSVANPAVPTDPPAGGDEPGDDPVDPPSATTPVARDFSLRGDPNFSRSQLASYQRLQYDRLWAELSDPSQFSEILRLADRDDLFTYGRQLQSYIQSILTAFRVTGDLELLDHVDIIMERMRAQLDYGWRDTNDDTDGTWGDYLMWVWRCSSGPSVYGKDNRIDDLKTHALIAMVAYALEVNRDLTSPGGRNYAAHADFWKHYLVDHFEAKLRDRFNKAGSVFPITAHSDGHSYYSWTKWHLYMGLLTGRDGYLAEANRMADILWGEIHSADTASGPAYVWTSNISQLSSSRNYLMTTSYAHSIYGDVVTFHFEGFHNWAQEEHLQAYARTITQFVFDTSDIVRNGITADIGGDVDQAGITSDSDRPRRTARAYTAYQYALISPWDESGRIYDVSHVVQDSFSSLDTTRLAAGLFLGTHIGPTATMLAGATAGN